MISGPWWAQFLMNLIPVIISSSGFWAYLQLRERKRSATLSLLLGLAYAKVVGLGMAYIERGWLTDDEFADFKKYYYQPYKDCGGNGVADRIMEGVRNLPLKNGVYVKEPIRRKSR